MGLWLNLTEGGWSCYCQGIEVVHKIHLVYVYTLLRCNFVCRFSKITTFKSWRCFSCTMIFSSFHRHQLDILAALFSRSETSCVSFFCYSGIIVWLKYQHMFHVQILTWTVPVSFSLNLSFSYMSPSVSLPVGVTCSSHLQASVLCTVPFFLYTKCVKWHSKETFTSSFWPG